VTESLNIEVFVAVQKERTRKGLHPVSRQEQQSPHVAISFSRRAWFDVFLGRRGILRCILLGMFDSERTGVENTPFPGLPVRFNAVDYSRSTFD
jgi:hypothetical protein